MLDLFSLDCSNPADGANNYTDLPPYLLDFEARRMSSTNGTQRGFLGAHQSLPMGDRLRRKKSPMIQHHPTLFCEETLDS